MHAHFFLRGDKDQVDAWVRWMMTRTMFLPFEKDGEKKAQPILLQIRYSIAGSYELVFPKEAKDIILTTLGFHKPPHPNTVKMRYFLKLLRLAMGLKKPKDFDTSEVLIMPENTKWCSVIPIGIHEDEVRYFKEGIGGDEVVEEAL